MAEVPAGTYIFFSVGLTEPTKSECFAVRWGDITSRIDPHFHRSIFRLLIDNLIAIGSKPLGSLVTYSEETWDNSDGRFISTFPYIEISGVGLGTNEYQVSEMLVSEAPSRARQVVRADDLLVSMTRPHRGAITRVLPEHDGAIASTGFAIVRNVENSQVSVDYLQLYLTSRFGSDQMLMRSSGGNYPAITREQLSQILVPDIGHERQQALISTMEAARAEYKKMAAETDALLAGLEDFILDRLGLVLPPKNFPQAFAVRYGNLTGLYLGPLSYAPEPQSFLRMLQSHPVVSQSLGAYVDINPQVDISGMHAQEIVGFIPMGSVSDGALGDYICEERPLAEVRKGYTPFTNGDILWAKITPSMQNGKSCIVEGLPNDVGFGSTEFHVLRVHGSGVSKEFVKEFISQWTVRQVATYAFTGSAGQQRVPAEFLENLPFPKLPEAQQLEIIEEIAATRHKESRQPASRW